MIWQINIHKCLLPRIWRCILDHHKAQNAVSLELQRLKAPLTEGDHSWQEGGQHNYNYPGRSEKAPANSNHSILTIWWFSHEPKARKYWIIRYENFYESENPDGRQVNIKNDCWYLIAVLEFTWMIWRKELWVILFVGFLLFKGAS